VSNALSPELQRRKSNTDAVMQFFRLRALRWIPATELEKVGGRQAWRSRVSDARKQFKARGEGTILNRQSRTSTIDRDAEGLPLRLNIGPIWSEYMFRPTPLGRDASTKIPQPLLFDTHPRG
jgi:predicted lipoprotein